MEYLYIVFVLMWILLTYRVAHKKGRREGEREGIKRTALTYKQRALDKGRCPICGHSPKPERIRGDKN